MRKAHITCEYSRQDRTLGAEVDRIRAGRIGREAIFGAGFRGSGNLRSRKVMAVFGRIASRDGARIVRARTGAPGERRASALGWKEAGLVRALLIVLIALVALASASFEPVRTARAQTQEDSSETLTQLMQRLSSEGMAELRHLTTFYSPRQPYSPEELAAAEYIEGKLKALGGYTVTVQPFRRRGEENEVSELSLVGSRARDVRFPSHGGQRSR